MPFGEQGAASRGPNLEAWKRGHCWIIRSERSSSPKTLLTENFSDRRLSARSVIKSLLMELWWNFPKEPLSIGKIYWVDCMLTHSKSMFRTWCETAMHWPPIIALMLRVFFGVNLVSSPAMLVCHFDTLSGSANSRALSRGITWGSCAIQIASCDWWMSWICSADRLSKRINLRMFYIKHWYI